MAGLALVLFCLATFWPLLAGMVVVPAEGLYFIDPVFAQHRPADVSPWQNLLLVGDLMGQQYVWRHFAADSLAAGRIPLWNPYSACGMPFLANDQTPVLNPTNLILNRLFDPAVAQSLFGLISLLLASLSTYGLVRALGGVPVGAFLAGLSYAFSGFVFIWLGYPLGATAALLPLLLWTTYRFADRPSATGAAAIGAVIGWQFLSGHLSTAVQVLAFWGVFVAYDMVRRRAAARAMWMRRCLAMAALGLVLGVGIGCVQLLPLTEYYRVSVLSETGRSPWSGTSLRESVERSLLGDADFMGRVAPGDVSLLFNPEAHGHPAFGDYEQHGRYGNYAERTLYPGMLGLVALGVALFQIRRGGHRRFFAVSAWVALAILLHLPLFNTFTYLPLLRLIGPQRLRFIFSLCAAVTLGLVASDSWSNASAGRRAGRPAPLIAIAAAIMSCAMAVHVLGGIHIQLGRLPVDLRVLRLAKLFVPATAAVAAAATFILAGRGRVSGKVMACALIMIAGLDLGIFDAKWEPVSRRDRVLPVLPEMASAMNIAGEGRISGPAAMLRPDLSVGYGCYDIRAYDPIAVGRYAALVDAAYRAAPDTNPLALFIGGQSSPLLECLTSVRARWKQDSRGRVSAVQVSGSLPRAYVARNVIARSGKDALETVVAGDPRRQTVIEMNAPASRGSAGFGAAEIADYSPQQVTVRANAGGPAWLVLTDTYFPGWQASVNGRPTRIASANYAFRAVAIPTGESTVTFSYEPASYRIGVFLTCLALCGLMGIVAGHVVGWGGVVGRRPDGTTGQETRGNSPRTIAP